MLGIKPLAGIRVLDLTRVLAGPFCTMNLADLGAEVIKVERPGYGDDSRHYPPIIPGSNDSGYFYSVNRGKLSVTLNLKETEAREIFLALVKKADVVVENFTPGTMARLGLDYPRLREANRGVILCSISGFGQSGPMAQAPAYDIVVQALGGTMSITGEPGHPPVRCGVSIGDLVAALYAVSGILAALRVRDHTGVGCHLDLAMLDCQVALLEDALARYSCSGLIPERLGTRHPSITPFQQFEAADGYFVVGAGNETLWTQFTAAIGMPELAQDERFANNVLRTRNHEELEQILAARFRQRTRDEWLELLHKARVPAAPVANVEEVSNSAQLKARAMIVRAQHKSFDSLLVPGSPFKIAGEPPTVPETKAPELGEHTELILSSLLGYDSTRIGELRQRGII